MKNVYIQAAKLSRALFNKIKIFWSIGKGGCGDVIIGQTVSRGRGRGAQIK